MECRDRTELRRERRQRTAPLRSLRLWWSANRVTGPCGLGTTWRGMMAGMDVGLGELHLAVCRRFGEAVRSADGKWDRPSPCDSWDARAVLEHVIGFHDVLLLRPLGLKPDRPRDDPQRRWELSFDRLGEAFGMEGLFERVVEVPAVGKNPPTQLDARKLVPRLTQERVGARVGPSQGGWGG
jgi:hypothetical protein